MRIIAGRLGGRHFASPQGRRTHPMSDKMRGALFNALGDIDGLSVLDAFAGSGALAFEAVSRGAGHAVAIDVDKSAQRAIAENISTRSA
jgi:16S rRNA (guanine966-N2)-methyltransferase